MAGVRYRDALRAGISRYTPTDRDEVLSFRREVYGTASIYANPSYLDWMYGPQPDGAEPRGALWIYRRDGKVEGQQGALKVTIDVRGQPHQAVWALDLMVSPKFQMRGIGAVLPEVAFDGAGIVLGTEVSEAARRTFLRAGWADTGTLPLYVRPLDLARLAEARSSRRAVAMLGAAGNLALRAADPALRAAQRLSTVRLEPVEAFDDRSERIWREISARFPVITRRDAAFLNWRFAQFPVQRYRLYYAYRRRELLGHLVLRTGEWNGLPAGFIVDFACAPQWTGALLAAAVAEFRGEPLAALYCLHLNASSTRPLSTLGFLRRDSGWRLMCRAQDRPPGVQALLEDQRSWFLTLAESNLDRPREGAVSAPASLLEA